jgi:hypothetical protein
MKKLLLLALATSLSLTNSSCSKNSEPAPVVSTPDYSQLILGYWVASSSVAVTTNSTGQATTKTTNYDYDHGEVSEAFAATYVTEYSMNAAVGTRPYSISGNTYTIDDGGGASRKFEIVTLSSSRFVRKFTSTSGTSTTVATTTLLR